MKMKLPERRRFVRIEVPLRVKVSQGNFEEEITTKNISPVGMRFEISSKVDESAPIDMAMFLPTSSDTIKVTGKVAWQVRTSLEDNAPYDVGVEITDIEEDGKNELLKYLCDLLYASSYRAE